MDGTGSPDSRLQSVIKDRLQRALDDTIVPGIAVAAGHGDQITCEIFSGRLGYEDDYGQVDGSTLWDLASLTKPIVGTSLVGLALQHELLNLNDSPARYHPAFRSDRWKTTTIGDLLAHAAGQPASIPFFLEDLDRSEVRDRIASLEPTTPPKVASVYSDLDFIVLWDVIEAAFGFELEDLAHRYIFDPLGMRNTLFNPSRDLRAHCAPTEYCQWRGRLVQGEVHDENCASLGGVTPHAGLFATISDVVAFLQAVLRARNGGSSWLKPDLAKCLTTRTGPPGGTFGLGWATPADGQGRRGDCLSQPWSLSAAGLSMSSLSFGHTGFTGTSMVADPATSRWLVVLGNRVHPTRDSEGMPELRRDLSDLVAMAAQS
jgi:CubicO group peptidase (beta-lactamase class C family)